jgi:hypothetical protein
MSAGDGDQTTTLETLLLEQRQALRAGRLDILASLPPRLEAALKEKVTPHDLERVRQTAAGNAVLLAAACEGVARARRQRADASAPSLTTYDSNGRISKGAGPAGRTIARR